MSRVGGWARRAALSALAGGGLTAAPLTGGALAAESSSASSGSTQPSAASAESGTGAQSTTTTTSTTPTTTSAGESPTPTTSSTTPSAPPTPKTSSPQSGSASPGSSGSPEGSARHHSKSPTGGKGPSGVGQHEQPTTSSTTSQQLPAKSPARPSAPKTGGVPAPGTPSAVPGANVAPAPQLLAGGALISAPLLSSSPATMRALSFYQIPMFLLPIYKAAAAQYGVPWQILAAINEVETDYGTDLSVSTAGAVGWMQFMPETWLQYGVDAVNAGYADPYNPVDAVFAAARYLHAAGASSNLSGAIFSYNHSQAYVQSVLLRARLIATYPESVIATLTGLTEGTSPVQGAKLVVAAASSGAAPSGGPAGAAPAPSAASASLPGATPAPAPALSAAQAKRQAEAPAPLSQLSELEGPSSAPVLAVEDGRIVQLGRSRKLGRYVVLRDTYGDVFTYAGLGSIVPSYTLPKRSQLSIPRGALRGLKGGADPSPSVAATAGRQLPLTLHVAAQRPAGVSSAQAGGAPESNYVSPLGVGSGKVRVFAHPGNVDALAAARAQAQRSRELPPGSSALRSGSLVEQGTVLGHLGVSRQGPQHAYLRFAIRPPGAQSAIDPAPVLRNWDQLDVALHPKGARGGDVLAGATAADAFLLSPSELERAVLADPGIRLSACDRHQVAAAKVDGRMLALLVFLSRSGLKPTVAQLSCGRVAYSPGSPVTRYLPAGTLTISQVNGVPIAGHQGAGTIADVLIRTLLSAKRPFAPSRIVSLMQYPGVPRTVASPDHANLVEVSLPPKPVLVAHTAHAPAAPNAASAPVGSLLGTSQWSQLMGRIGAIPAPKVSRRPSSAAIRDSRP